ncbi:MAG TPA: tetratricopeptide repeat protein [Vicinamibacterales bacterium]|nr:tetratricopeptide repeat protein [Vicinamibacterales bacterium]
MDLASSLHFGRRSAAALCLAAALLSGCGGDPSVRKRKFVESGDQYIRAKKVAEAIIQYRNAVQLDATFGEARKKLAQAYAAAGDGPHAFEEYVRAADLLPNDIDVQLAAGALLLMGGKSEDALARADAALKLQPENTQAHVLRGNALAGLSSFDEALKAIEEAIRLNPTQGNTFTNLGLVQLARGRRVEAEAAFKKAVDLSPGSVEAHLALGNFYWSVGKPDETERAFSGALRAQPDSGPANRAMAALAVATGRYRDAEPYLRRMADSSTDPNVMFGLIDYYLASGRAKEAIERLETMRKTGDSPVLGQRLARAYAAAGDTTKASALVEQVLASNPTAVEAQLLKGQLLLSAGKRDDAFATVRSAATANPSSAEAQFALGRMYASRGDVSAAETAFREVLRINPRAGAAQLEISRLQLNSGKTEESVRTAEEATKNQPGSIAARLALVRSLLASKNLVRAEREIADLQSEQPKVADVQVQAGFLAILKNDVPAARRAFDRAAAINPKSLDVLSGFIAADLKANDAAGAKARIEKRLSEGATPALLLIAARTYWTTNDQPAAERALRAAIDSDPSNLQPYAMLGQLYMAQKKLDQARTEFEAVAARQAKPIGALTMVGMIHQAQGHTPLARKRFEEVLALDSRAAVAANNLAWIYAETGENLDVALQLAQTATAVAPEVPELMDTLGWVYYKKNLPHLAIPLFERSAAKAPNNAGYQHHLGLSYLQAGDVAKGRAALQRALAAGPDAATSADIRGLLEKTATTAGGATRP